MEQQKKAQVLALVSVLMWSTVAVSFKIGLRDFHFIHFLIINIGVAVLISLLNLLLLGDLPKIKELNKKQWGIAVLGGFLNPFLYYLMLFKAYSILPAQIAQALNYTWPIMLVLLSVPFLGQKLKSKNLMTLLIGFIGVYLIASEGKPFAIEPTEPMGVLLALSTSVVWALYWLLNTKSSTKPSINLFINFSVGFILTLPFALKIPFDYNVSTASWIAVIYSGIFEMGLTFVLWLAAMRLTQRTDQISNYVFMSPFMSLFFIYFMLKEQIYLSTIIGLALIVSSVFLNARLNKNANLT